MKKILIIFILFLTAVSSNAQFDSKGDNSFSLNSLISVTIGGDFLVTGSFPASITERVDQFVTRMYNQAREKALSSAAVDAGLYQEIQKDFDQYSLRNIKLKRSSGEEIRIDLLKFRRTGDFSLNPYLKNDDVLIFAPTDIEHNFFSVSGAVNKPGKFHFVSGDKLSDAIELTYGINKAYENVNKVEVHRLSYDGETKEIINADIGDDIPLQRGDRIVVVADETQRMEFSVLVLGEVKRPGLMPITRNSTMLKSVIEDAGGFTDEASLKRAKFFRGRNNIRFILEKEFGIDLENYQDNLRGWPNPILADYEKSSMLRMSSLTEEDTAFFVIDEQIRQMVTEASVDFSTALDSNSETANMRVRDGDIIIIPPKQYTVYVYGQVANPGLIKYEEGKDYSYYLNLSGGVGEFAEDEDEIVIIKGDTKEWIYAGETSYRPLPGDYIYVPKNPNRSFNYYAGQVGNYLSIVGSAATIILLLIQFNK